MAGRQEEVDVAGAPGGERFAFGKNWVKFVRGLNDERMRMARESLEHALVEGWIEGRIGVAAGSGRGLFSLSAIQLGWSRGVALALARASVGCPAELKRRGFPSA